MYNFFRTKIRTYLENIKHRNVSHPYSISSKCCLIRVSLSLKMFKSSKTIHQIFMLNPVTGQVAADGELEQLSP